MPYLSGLNRDKRVPPTVDQLLVIGDPDQGALKETGDRLGTAQTRGYVLHPDFENHGDTLLCELSASGQESLPT